MRSRIALLVVAVLTAVLASTAYSSGAPTPRAVTFDSTPVGLVSSGAYVEDGALRSDGHQWWYLDDPAYTVNGDFRVSYDLRFAPSAHRDIANFAFWTSDPGEYASGYVFRLQTSSGYDDGGFFTVHGGGHHPTSTGLHDLHADTWYRTTLIATGSSVRAVVAERESGAVVVDMSATLPEGNRSGVFGQKHDGARAAEGHQWDNLDLDPDDVVQGPDELVLQPDQTPPVVTGPGNTVIEAVGPTGAVGGYTATAYDAVDGDTAVSCLPASGSLFPLGTTTVTCETTDLAGNTSSTTGSVLVRDTMGPTLGATAFSAEASSGAGAPVAVVPPATDLVDGPVAATCLPALAVYPVGTTSLSCTSTDRVGNLSTRSGHVTVQDTTGPAITLTDVVAEATSATATVVTFTPSATDLVDGQTPVSCSPASGSVFPLGSTEVSCSSADDHGNTTPAAFVVRVEDTTAPVLVVPSSLVREATGPDGAVVAFAPSASDAVDGPSQPVCTPASGVTFDLGPTSVTCTAVDSRRNAAAASFAVTVQDTTAPALSVPGDVELEATGADGAAYAFTPTATDAVSTPTASCDAPRGSVFPLGTTEVACAATDAAGNEATRSFSVTVRDTTGPTVAVPGDQDVAATDRAGAVVRYSSTATDAVDGPTDAVCTPASGSTFPVGRTVVTCGASDRAGNAGAPASFAVTVAAPPRAPAPPLVAEGPVTVAPSELPARVEPPAPPAPSSAVALPATAPEPVAPPVPVAPAPAPATSEPALPVPGPTAPAPTPGTSSSAPQPGVAPAPPAAAPDAAPALPVPQPSDVPDLPQAPSAPTAPAAVDGPVPSAAAAPAVPVPSASAAPQAEPDAVDPVVPSEAPAPAPTAADTPGDPVTATGSDERPALEPGLAMSLLDGEPSDADVTVTGTRTQVRAGSVSLGVAAQASDGSVRRPDDDGTLRFERGGKVHVTGSGYLPGSEIVVWMFSDPVRVGSSVAGPDGRADAVLPVPADLPGGEHTLQMNGVSEEGVRSISLGVFLDGSGVPLWQAVDHPAATVATQVALFAALGVGALAASGAAQAAAAGARTVPQRAPGRPVPGPSSPGRSAPGRTSAGSAAAAQSEREKGAVARAKYGDLETEVTGLAAGDRSRSWQVLPSLRSDAVSRTWPVPVAPVSPLLARVLVDGTYLRAMLGGLAPVVLVVAAVAGAVAALGSDALGAPTAVLLGVVLVLGFVDALAGLVASAAFVSVLLLTGQLSTTDEVRGALGVTAVWFLVPLLAGYARPARRPVCRTAADVWYRVGDFVVSPLLVTWITMSLIGAFPGLYGHSVAAAGAAPRLALLAGAAVVLRLLAEEAAVRYYPARLAWLAHGDLPRAGVPQQLVVAVARTGLYLFVAAPFVGVRPELFLGAAIFYATQLVSVFGDRLPKSLWLHRVLPRGMVELSALVVLGWWIGAQLQGAVPDPRELIAVSFVVLALPGLAKELLGCLKKRPDARTQTWWDRAAGALAVTSTTGVLYVLTVA